MATITGALAGASTVAKGVAWLVRRFNGGERKAFVAVLEQTLEDVTRKRGRVRRHKDVRALAAAWSNTLWAAQFQSRLNPELDQALTTANVADDDRRVYIEALEREQAYRSRLNNAPSGGVANDAIARSLRDAFGDWVPALRQTIFELAMFPSDDHSGLTKKLRGSDKVADIWTWSGDVAERLAMSLRRSPALRGFVETLEVEREAAAREFKLNAEADLLLAARRAADGLHRVGRGIILIAAVAAASAVADGLNVVEITHWLSRIGD